ncbi:metallophosphoesterase family protein [Kribbia dieselivorans]|uniref:metallophosphoesterase family protein n=1 Tax=Kribbia dieselivorans TaxID=331526 RepID=UPI00083812E9|nr:metallophosphoesterase family protein [Kribbia dieselivorans]
MNLNRRHLLAASGIAAVTTALATPAQADSTVQHHRSALRFNANGDFKIVMFNDTQDNQNTDVRTIELITKVLQTEKPDLVVFVGDNINGGPRTAVEQYQALNNVVAPVDAAGIPWAVTWGNHDEDSTPRTGVDEADMLAFVQKFDHNVNPDGPRDVTGTGNAFLPIGAHANGAPRFAAWLLDSGRYAPKEIAGQRVEGYETWDWLRADQVAWYLSASQELEKRTHRRVPGLMFIHIALWEHRFMWFGSAEDRSDAAHAKAAVKHQIVGDRFEPESPGPFNSGMYSAIQHRGDVEGVFVGHDHTNDYVGNYFGVKLGFTANAGYGTYGMGGAAKNTRRGARVFEIKESGDWTTRMVWAKDLGVDVSAAGRPGTPAPLPAWFRA